MTGIDPSAEAIELAGSVAPGARLLCGTAADVPPGEPYDVISLWDSLAHVPDAAGELRQYLERLAPGGTLLVKTPYRPPRFLYAAAFLLGWRPELRDDLTHSRITAWHFTPASLSALLRSFGLTVVSWRWAEEVPDPRENAPRSLKTAGRDALAAILRRTAGPHPSFVMLARK